MKTVTSRRATLYWVSFAAILFIPFLGNVHLFDWDEINFAEIAREMLVSNNYGEPQMNFVPFTEKPPLFFWLQAISMKIFGVNEFAARFPNALLGVLVLPLLYHTGKKLKDNRFGILWALVYVGTVLPHLYFKSGIIDPWFNFFIFSSLHCLVLSAWKKTAHKNNTWLLIAGGAFLGLAVLTKGPAALLILGLVFVVYWLSEKFRMFISVPQLLIFALSTLFVTGLWFGINYLQHGSKFMVDFTIRQWQLLTTEDAGHGGFFLYHFVVIFFGCFPATVFLVQSLFKREGNTRNFADYKKWMAILFWVVLILFTIVKTKIVHYSSLCYYPLGFLAAVSLYNIAANKWEMKGWMKWLLVISGLPFLIAPFAFAWFGKHISQLKPLLSQDPFAVENLQADIHWSGWEFLPGLWLILVLVFSFIWLRQKEFMKAFYMLFAGTAVYVQITLFFLIKRIEGYSQRANVEFFKSHAKEDCYMATYNYLSYTLFFYGEMRPHPNKNYADKEWLFKGNIDKPVYFSCRVEAKERLKEEIPDAVFLYNRNGFYFYKRLPK